MAETLLKKPTNIPKVPGIYIFRNAHTKPLYIGKAANLRARVRSYFQKNISDRILRLRNEAHSLEFIVLPNEFDALIKEAELIKRHQPKFNILLRDDKSYYYVQFSNSPFPRVIVVHRPTSHRAFGPYTESTSLYAVLRMVRKIFPYCTCKTLHARRCLNAEIGRCFGFCCEKGAVASREQKVLYAKNIFAIKKMLAGKSQELIRTFKKNMLRAADCREFEKAIEYRNSIRHLENIFSHRAIIRDHNPFIFNNAKASSNLQNIVRAKNPIMRIEGYDVSMLAGTAATASMVVFENGRPQNQKYRRFQIKDAKTTSDYDMIGETLERRFHNLDWPLPDMILVDGGAPQLQKVALVAQKFFGNQLPFVLTGLSKAKRANGTTIRKASERELFHIWNDPNKSKISSKDKRTIVVGKLPQEVMHTLQHIRDEAHRFARVYHHLLRKKAIKS
ncbi:MAG: GIY-YIG nuclease family protein [Patescibacteria group bacterium]